MHYVKALKYFSKRKTYKFKSALFCQCIQGLEFHNDNAEASQDFRRSRKHCLVLGALYVHL